MKKFIVSAFLVVLLSAFFCSVAYAEGGIAYFSPLSNSSNFVFSSSHHLSAEAMYRLVNDMAVDEGNAVSGLSFSSSVNVIIHDARLGIVDGKYYCCIVHDKPNNQYVLGGYQGSTFLPYYCLPEDLTLFSRITGYIDQIEGRLARTVDGLTYTVADSTYHTWQTLKDMSGYLVSEDDTGTKYTVASWVKRCYNSLVSPDSASGVKYTAAGWLRRIHERLAVTNGYVDGLEGKLDTIADLLTSNQYMCGYTNDVDGNPFPRQALPYEVAVDIVARLNSDLVGKDITVLLRSGGTSIQPFSRAAIFGGFICIYINESNYYFLCDPNNVIYTVDSSVNSSIYNRMSDVISAVNSLTVGVDLSDVTLQVDSSNISLWDNNAFCCAPLASDITTLSIPYDTVTAILNELNTNYIGKKATILLRAGGTSVGYFRSASISSQGYILVKLTNGVQYYLSDNTGTIYMIDQSSNYGSRIESLLTDKLSSIQNVMTDTKDSMVSRLDVIIENLEGIRANSEITVVQQIQQHSDDVNSGVDSVGQILTLVRDFFNPGVEADWGEARNYAMNWGNDE